MAELKTKMTDAPVDKFINGIKDKTQREESLVLLDLLKKTTAAEPKMWGSSIVGFGQYHYKSKSGREGDWFLTGFSPRKQNMTIYFCLGFEKIAPLLKILGKHKTGVGCLYIRHLADVDVKVLTEMLKTYFKSHTK